MKTLRSLLLVAVLIIASNAYGESGNRSETNNTVAKTRVQDMPVQNPDVYPEFVGGEEALLRFLKNNIVYPDAVYTKGIEGKVTVRFVVTAEGQIRRARIVKGVGCVECDQEALRLIYSMPEWIPGSVNGKAVDCTYIVPVQFRAR